MLDTVILTLDRRHFEVLLSELFSPSAKGLLTPPYYSLGSRGIFACYQNPRQSRLKAAQYKPRLTLSRRKSSNGFVISLKVEFSAPKLLLGNNFNELETGDFGKVLVILHRHLTEMGISVSIDGLRVAPVSGIHYSKNIAFTDYTTCSMVLSELERIDLTKRLDLSHTTYRNEGHAIRYHANTFDIIFYDKLRDLDRARYSEKRGIEQEYGGQLDTDLASLPKQLEVLRMEVRLGTRAKIRNILNCIDAGATPLLFENLFSADLAKEVLNSFWSKIFPQLVPLANDVRPEAVLSRLAAATNGNTKPGKLLQQLGAIVLVESIGVRGAAAVMRRHGSSRSWQRHIRDLKVPLSFRIEGFSAAKAVDKALSEFAPLRIELFSSPRGQGKL
jgi:hypothetical protein